MKPLFAMVVLLGLSVPTLATAQVEYRDEAPASAIVLQDIWGGQDAGQDVSAALDDENFQPGDVQRLDAAARVGPRGRVIVRPGPRGRGRARTFQYRGRPLAVYRGPRYVYPRGFGYRRWRSGQLFPLALLAAPFFFLEYQALGLQAPPPGYRWVRYGPDVVLVNERTREIEDVAYNAIDDEDD